MSLKSPKKSFVGLKKFETFATAVPVRKPRNEESRESLSLDNEVVSPQTASPVIQFVSSPQGRADSLDFDISTLASTSNASDDDKTSESGVSNAESLFIGASISNFLLYAH